MIEGFGIIPRIPTPYVSLDQMEGELADADTGLSGCQEMEAQAREVTADTMERFKTLKKMMVVRKHVPPTVICS